MDQDVNLGVTMAVTQADLVYLRQTARLGEFPVVYRVHRQQKGGGFGDQSKHPFSWGVLVYVDTQLARINSARGFGREWNDLARVEVWLRAQGFRYWWTRNDLEPVGEFQGLEEDDEEAGTVENPGSNFPDPGTEFGY
ncbi:hypothetical protein [Kiloniella sp.]|uniref:hypothetical protein n=1 Tax=Kiloniella sp. TaxID=1938587 RepID=UPI003B01B998